MSNDNRPTSPHLTIYRPQITSVLSIIHRLTGVALVAGSALIVVWLWSVAYASAFYTTLHGWLASDIGRALLLAWTAAFFYHFSNGIRHLFWDIGWGFSLPQVSRSGWTVIFFTLAMTAVTWGFVTSSVGH